MRRTFQDGMEITYGDLNAIAQGLEREIFDRVLLQILQGKKDRFFGSGFLVEYASATSVTVRAGVGFQEDTTQTSPEPTQRMIYKSSSTTLTVGDADATNDRIDIVVVKAGRADTTSASRKYKDATSSEISTETLVVETDWQATVSITEGTAAATPVAPDVPDGYIKIAEIYVTAVTGVAATGAITDSRDVMPIGPDLLLDTSDFDYVTTKAADTKLSTVLSEIDGKLNGPFTSPIINGAKLEFGTGTDTNRFIGPKVTTTQREALTDAAGLLVYDTDTASYWVNDGTDWVEVGSGSGGGGVMNYATNPSATTNTDGWTSSTGSGLARTTTEANLPSGTTTPHAFELTLSGDGDYVYARFKLNAAHQNAANLLLKLAAKLADSGVWKLEVYENPASDYSGTYTEIPLTSDDSDGDTFLPATTAEFTTFWTPKTNAYIEFRIVHVGAVSNTIYWSDTLLGPGTASQGAYVGPWTDFPADTFALVGSSNESEFTNYQINSAKYYPVGENLHAEVEVGFTGTPGTGAGNFALVFKTGSDFTVDTQGATSGRTIRGMARYQISAATPTVDSKFASYSLMQQGGIFTDISSTALGTVANGDKLFLTFEVPIAEWKGKGTVNLLNVDRQSPLKAGLVMAWPDDTLPTGWLECDGTAVSRTLYRDLYAVVGDKYGDGDGSTTFNLPDYRGYFLRGQDGGAGNDPDAASRTDRGDGTTGDNVGTKQDDSLESHSHGFSVVSPSGNNPPASPATILFSSGNEGSASTSVVRVGATGMEVTGYDNTGLATGANRIGVREAGGNETRPKNVSVIWIIKAHNDSADIVGYGQATATQHGLIALSSDYAATDNQYGLIAPYNSNSIVQGGSYTPVLGTGTGGYSGLTIQKHVFTRVGPIVTVSGEVAYTATSATTTLVLSLPIERSTTSSLDIKGGTGWSNSNTSNARVLGTSGSSTEFSMIALSAGSGTQTVGYTFQYEID